jgi:hypothetical protein
MSAKSCICVHWFKEMRAQPVFRPMSFMLLPFSKTILILDGLSEKHKLKNVTFLCYFFWIESILTRFKQNLFFCHRRGYACCATGEQLALL